MSTATSENPSVSQLESYTTGFSRASHLYLFLLPYMTSAAYMALHILLFCMYTIGSSSYSTPEFAGKWNVGPVESQTGLQEHFVAGAAGKQAF